MKRSGLVHVGLDYHVTAILGCQSSGKSTLLNLLFGTQFQVMDDQKGRYQTTEGVWIARAKGAGVLVMDVEGTDSKERGEEHMNFERMSSLFSLALAEVLIINVWAADLGRYNASNYGLLKTVFEVNLKLFAKKGAPKTTLLFVIRDHVSSPLDTLSSMIVQDLDKIWSELQKPVDWEDVGVADFFNFKFMSLPHFVLKRAEFDDAVDRLRLRFSDSSDPDYVFTDDIKKTVPADGFFNYASTIWKTISEDKDLDLPSQKEMLSVFRCDEILESVYDVFSTMLSPTVGDLSNGQAVAGFGERAGRLLSNAIEEYNVPASRYHSGVCNRKRGVLVERICGDLQRALKAQLELEKEAVVSAFQADVKATVGGGGRAAARVVRGFSARMQELRGDALDQLQAAVSASKITPTPPTQPRADAEGDSEARTFDWSTDAFVEEVAQELEAIVSSARKEQLEASNTELAAWVDAQVVPGVEEALKTGGKNMWERMLSVYEGGQSGAAKLVGEMKEALLTSDEEGNVLGNAGRAAVYGAVSGVVRAAAEEGEKTALSVFDGLMRYDKNGLPRIWGPGVEVEPVFLEARSAGYDMLDNVSRIQLWGDDGVPEGDWGLVGASNAEEATAALVLVDGDELKTLRKRFDGATEAVFLEKKRVQEAAGVRTSIPPWAIVLMLVLGRNDIISVLTNPLWGMFIVLLVASAVVIHTMGLTPVVIASLGPMKAVALGVLQQVLGDQSGAGAGAGRPVRPARRQKAD